MLFRSGKVYGVQGFILGIDSLSFHLSTTTNPLDDMHRENIHAPSEPDNIQSILENVMDAYDPRYVHWG